LEGVAYEETWLAHLSINEASNTSGNMVVLYIFGILKSWRHAAAFSNKWWKTGTGKTGVFS